jgi:hypothetical protein
MFFVSLDFLRKKSVLLHSHYFYCIKIFLVKIYENLRYLAKTKIKK